MAAANNTTATLLRHVHCISSWRWLVWKRCNIWNGRTQQRGRWKVEKMLPYQQPTQTGQYDCRISSLERTTSWESTASSKSNTNWLIHEWKYNIKAEDVQKNWNGCCSIVWREDWIATLGEFLQWYQTKQYTTIPVWFENNLDDEMQMLFLVMREWLLVMAYIKMFRGHCNGSLMQIATKWLS